MIDSRVSFEDARHGKLTGTVRGITNDQQKAIVELDNELPGLMQAVPVSDLVPEETHLI